MGFIRVHLWLNFSLGVDMHEIGIAKGILKKALEFAEANKGKKITTIYLKVGIGEMLTQEALQQAFSMLAKDTILRRTKVEMEEFVGMGITMMSIEVE